MDFDNKQAKINVIKQYFKNKFFYLFPGKVTWI